MIINGYHLAWLQERCLHICQKQLLIREQTSNNSQSPQSFFVRTIIMFLKMLIFKNFNVLSTPTHFIHQHFYKMIAVLLKWQSKTLAENGITGFYATMLGS